MEPVNIAWYWGITLWHHPPPPVRTINCPWDETKFSVDWFTEIFTPALQIALFLPNCWRADLAKKFKIVQSLQRENLLLDEWLEQVLFKKGFLWFCCHHFPHMTLPLTPAMAGLQTRYPDSRQTLSMTDARMEWESPFAYGYRTTARLTVWTISPACVSFPHLLNEDQTRQSPGLTSPLFLLNCEWHDPHTLPRQPKVNRVKNPSIWRLSI